MLDSVNALSKSQTIILIVLTTLTVMVFCALGIILVNRVILKPNSAPAPVAVSQQPSPSSRTPTPVPSATPMPDTTQEKVNTPVVETPTPTITPPNTRVVNNTATPTNTAIRPVTPQSTSSATPSQSAEPTPSATAQVLDNNTLSNWIRYDSPTNKVAVMYPDTVEVLEEKDVVQFMHGEVHLEQGALKEPIAIIHIFKKGSQYLPQNVDHSDSLALLIALHDIYFAGWEDQLHQWEAPQATSFNGYPGAKTVVNRIDKENVGGLFPVDIVYYLATVDHGDRVLRIQIQARKGNGGELIPAFAEQFLRTIELY